MPGGERQHPLVYDRVAYAYRGGEEAVRDVSIRLEEGKVVLITGPSGAGKTTVCRMANGLIPHEFKGRLAGSVTIAGRYDSRKLSVSALSKIVGVLSQDPETQLFNPTVEEEIVFGACNYGLPVETIRERTERLLELTRLKPHRHKNPHNLSGGQQQSCALASILAFDPLVLVLDEPTSNIDPIGSQQVLELVARLAREENRTTLLVEHKIEELADLVDEMIVLHEGEILHRGPVREVLEHVEYIDSVGLSVPQVTLLCAKLRSAGWPIERLPIGIEEAVEVLAPLIDREALSRAPQLPPRRVQHGEEEVVVEITGLSHVYRDGTRALSGVDLEIRRGEFVGVLGQNGSGKTTLVKHLNGLLKPTEGTVTVAGLDTRKATIAQMAQTVGYIFQNPDSQIFKMKVGDELAFGPQNVGLSEEEVAKRVREAAGDLEISHLLEKNPFFLSKGEKQRIAVAAVMAMKPDILVLDEPTTGQDFKRAREIMDLAVRLHAEGQTVIVITHDMNLAAEYCDRVVIMEGGRVLLDAPAREAFLARKKLEASSLRPPQVTVLGEALGYREAWLTVDEAVEMLGASGGV
ncbi:energy-coupling factor ABC transporter ATP-binding protein [Rubrobacter taiwanensis]|uniref:Energy-coupling factor ABC transporter ATP-binding protein n=1 Tax=Rubrobacter taiwanensis TaxID=185139 RepID=A0A4R1BHN3_9ACTN|nr:ABC transporter ATP-binding protein [Rubrobacter taiwanensis]TCJ16714.1 energy-coupling factor ABC transporter ATP-binding protein [Rubrobacter taiwanensis]